METKKSPALATAVLLIACPSLVSCSAHGGVRAAGQEIPVASVKQSDLQLEVNTTGELRSTQTVAAIAPPVAGDTLQIIRLVKTGMAVKAGDVVVAFDPSEQEYKLAQSRSDFDQAEQEIVKARDDAAVQVAQDQTALLKARFAVRQAELDVSKNDILSAIDAKKNLLTLEEAKRALAQLQQDIQSHTASNEASIAVAEEKRNKAKLAMTQAQKNIENMQVHSPIDGLVVVRENQNSTGGFFFGGMTLPPYQVGDQANPGNVIADVVDMTKMEVSAKVKESDRPSIQPGQQVEIHVDAIPNQEFPGKVKTVAGMVANTWFDDPSHNFDVTAELEHPDGRLRPGFAAHVVILGDHLQHALSIPRQAVFNTDGKPKVYVKTGGGFEGREVKIRYLTEALAIVDGLKEGVQVALVNPQQQRAKQSEQSGSAGPAIGAGPQ
ncbi:MAG TPA: efflux RND transporter periplasmic adaptor subunit [Candidatus Acidoferrum sp.]|nr:efflux RND transporter periplasmic adaptor subunit [Candidatus Acidoferrum sp.]